MMETTTMDKKDKDNSKIGKEPDKTNPEDLLDYIQPFTHLFNKKKFKKLPERREWDHEINLMEEALKELNAKAYAMTLKEEEALNQWLDESGTHCRVKVKICGTLFLYPKKGRFTTISSRLLEVKSSHDKGQNATTINWRSNRQAQGGEILQQTGLNLGLQQCSD